MTSPNPSSEEVIGTTAVTVIIGFGDIFDLTILKNVKEYWLVGLTINLEAPSSTPEEKGATSLKPHREDPLRWIWGLAV